MSDTFDKDKIIECMFDPVTSEILSELENGEKDSDYLSGKLEISEEQIYQKLSYLIEHEFVLQKTNGEKKIYDANADKLDKVIENDKNFDNVVDGLTEMDSYLN